MSLIVSKSSSDGALSFLFTWNNWKLVNKDCKQTILLFTEWQPMVFYVFLRFDSNTVARSQENLSSGFRSYTTQTGLLSYRSKQVSQGIVDIATEDIVLSGQWTTKAPTRLHGCVQADVCRLMCVFGVCIWHKTAFFTMWLIISSMC